MGVGEEVGMITGARSLEAGAGAVAGEGEGAGESGGEGAGAGAGAGASGFRLLILGIAIQRANSRKTGVAPDGP